MYQNTSSPFKMLLNQYGQPYSVERNSQIISELIGMPNHEKATAKAYVGFIPWSDLKPGDWIINSVGERFFIKDVVTDFFMKTPNQLKAFYLTETEFNTQQKLLELPYLISEPQPALLLVPSPL